MTNIKLTGQQCFNLVIIQGEIHMNMDVKPLHAFLIISFFVVLILCYAWVNGESVTIMGPDSLYKNKDDHLFIRVDNRLMQFDNNGLFKKNINLQDLGADESVGHMLFIGSSDVLLRIGSDNRSFYQKIRSFFRLKNTNAMRSQDNHSGLYQCNLETFKCNRFTRQNVDYNSVFHLQRDKYDGSVFLSDGERHRIVKYDAQGNEKYVFDTDLKFPNQMVYLDNKLYLVNTNRQQIKVIGIKQEGFEVLDNIGVISDVAIQQHEIFPASIALVGDQWWIINMDVNMSSGGVYRFDSEWTFLDRLDLPEAADPVSILMLNSNEVLIADPTNFVLYRFDSAGIRLQDYHSLELETLFGELINKRDYYVNLSYVPMVLFFIALVIGVIVGVRIELKHKLETKSQPEKTAIKPVKTKEVVWLTVNNSLLRQMNYLMAGILILSVLNILLLYSMFDDLEITSELTNSFIFLTVVILVLPAGLIIYLRYIFKAQIGIQGEYIHLKDHHGHKAMGHISDVYYDSRAIILNNIAVMTGNKMKPFYVKDEMEQYLYPVLEKGQRINTIRMMLMLYKLRHPVMYFEIFTVTLCLIMLVMVG